MMKIYRLTYTLLLAVMLVGGSTTMTAQVVIRGNVYGGGNLASVKTNTEVNMGGGTVEKNVYGGGNVGSVGTYDTSGDMKTFDFTANTGECNVTISGGTIGTGVAMSADGTFANGNVYGAGKGEADTYWCEKAMVYKTNVIINAGTVNGTVYGGGQIGRVENNATVTIGVATPADNTVTPTITGNVFGAGAGLKTHGYSALLRGNTEVTIQGYAQVGLSVYGGGEKASVGRFKIVDGLPSEPQDGGTCKVTVKGNAKIGTTGTDHNVFGSCQGVAAPTSFTAYDPTYKSMQTAENAPNDANAWEYVENTGQKYIWEYYPTLDAYKGFLNTLALASHTDVEIGGSASVYGSVFGGGQRGITLGNVEVDIIGGTIHDDVYGGGALADTNKGNQTAEKYDMATVTVDVTVVTGMYERTGAGTDESPYEYTLTGDTKAASGKTYYTKAAQSSINTTTVNLTGGLINGDAYGGGLGQKNGFNGASGDIAAVVWGDISVNLGSNAANTSATAFNITHYTGDHASVVKSGRVFGCNNLYGSPQGDVTVTVWKTVTGKLEGVENTRTNSNNLKNENATHTYEVADVYGGGNLANFTATGKKAYVIIKKCDVSIECVYGGGNAAEVPGTDVLVEGAYEINEVFGGGNGKDPYTTDDGTTWRNNPGANIGNSTTPGNANTLLTGGLVHAAYGGSNEKGTIFGNVSIDIGSGGDCTLDLEKMVGAGKNADVNGNLIMILGCKPSAKIPVLYAGADQANVNGNVELTITSGNYGKVFGGNNLSGAIRGHIKLNIEETSDCDPAVPIQIDELYLGGNQAAYSKYGYYVKTTTSELEQNPGVGASTETAVLTNNKLTFMPRKSADDPHKPVKSYSYDEEHSTWEWEVYTGTTEENTFTPYAEPVLNVISCTRIGRVFGGGYGEGAALYGNPVVNINMVPGFYASRINRDNTTGNTRALGEIGGSYTNADNEVVEGGVFGGGDGAAIYGNTTVNIGTATTVETVTQHTHLTNNSQTTGTYNYNVEGAYIVGNVYGGGREADVTGNTYVNICAIQDATLTTADIIGYKGVTISGTDFEGVTIKGNVFGGGKGVTEAAGVTGAFECAKAMVGVVNANNGSTDITKESIDKGTRVSMGNGTVEGNVYGGGEVGRVEWNGVVTIGLPVAQGETSAPVIGRNVFGGGKGVEQYGYAALLRGNTFVTIQANAKVGLSVYGGGEIASVGKYNIVQPADVSNSTFMAEHPGIEVGMPYSLANEKSGYCNVIVRGNAEIGPNNMKMYYANGDAPDDEGHVFGAGKGVLPYENEATFNCQASGHTGQKHPGRMSKGDVWECYNNQEAKYLRFIETQALATHTEVTIDGNAFVKGSVYGGSLSGHVQHDTHVTIADGQIGNGDGINERYTTYYGAWPTTQNIETNWAACAHWEFDENDVAPYDPYAEHQNPADNKWYYDSGYTEYANGGSKIAKNGQTYYGNVFGGGSGVVPYGPGKWHREAGSVGGNTVVDIIGGHILTSVYGGNECTDVGTYDPSNRNLVAGTGKSIVNVIGGTIGVPRTSTAIEAHPMISCVYGGGKGDPRVNFNKWTNVGETEVNITKNARIYGSVFGGGEDGHVLGDAETNIGGEVTIGSTTHTHSNVIIGSQGQSGADGNVFGGGRGFSEEALTAGVVCGNVTLNIHNGKMLGTVYGGGRQASVGTHLAAHNIIEDPNGYYGTLIPNGYNQVIGSTDVAADGATHGTITINIDGGTIGATNAQGNLLTSTHSIGDVFGGCKGSGNNKQFGLAKKTIITMEGGTVNGNVYGGGELGYVGEATLNSNVYVWNEETAGGGLCTVGISGGTVKGNVFGAGKGLADDFECEKALVRATSVTISKSGSTGTTVSGNVYGGGEVGRVDQNTVVTIGNSASDGAGTEGGTDAVISGNVFGAGAGVETHGYSALVRHNATVTIQGNASVGQNVYGGGMIAAVGRYALDGLGMPTTLVSGGECKVTVKGYAKVGPANGGNVFGAGMGVNPSDAAHNFDYTDPTVSTGKPKRMTRYTNSDDYPENAQISDTSSPTATTSKETIWEYCDDYDENAETKYIWEYYTTQEGYLDFLQTLALATDTKVSIEGNASVKGSVYGGSESGFVQRDTDVKIKGACKIGATDTGGNITTEGNIFGGGLGVLKNEAAGRVRRNTTITILSGTIYGDVYGGGALGKSNTVPTSNIYPTATVNLLGGTITGDVFGGGLGNSETGKETAADVGNTIVNLNGLDKSFYDAADATMKTTFDTFINKTDGVTAYPLKTTLTGCIVEKRIFGANNVNGTPKGHVKVHIFATQNPDVSTYGTIFDKPLKPLTKGDYDMTAVFGGGNNADYVPAATDTQQSTEVIIEGCDLTSIEEVYGGGFGAATPGTMVEIRGTYIIDNVFGGGYGDGSSDPTAADYNPGANVGFYTSSTDESDYPGASGKAVVRLMAGTVNNVYGGSNTKGDIRGGSSITNITIDPNGGSKQPCCDKLEVGNIYGGGKDAPMYGGAEIVLGCMPNDWISEIYAGAERADVGNDVSLTITSGKFGRVFGGNKSGGKLDGQIEVNIEESETCGTPIIIGELYGGGNLAPYSIYGYLDDGSPRTTKLSTEHNSPRVNVRRFTSIGNIYGGGLGADAVMVGNPTVNINEVAFDMGVTDYKSNAYNPANDSGKPSWIGDGENQVKLYSHEDGKIGVIGNVYGGGNAAQVRGNTNVNIGTEASVKFESLIDENIVGDDKRVTKTVVGADIRGNIYGGGNEAEVTGNTNVNIGKKEGE